MIKPGVLRQTRPGRRTHAIKVRPVAKVLAGLLAAVVVGLVIVGSIVGSDNGGGGEKGNTGTQHKAQAALPPASTTTATAPPGQVSVELRSTALVWVCLVDENGTPLVNGETLSPDESRGPFSATGFDVTFGNGSVEMTVNGEPARIPAAAEPIGYRINSSGANRLDPGSQPTCQ